MPERQESREAPKNKMTLQKAGPRGQEMLEKTLMCANVD